MEECVIIFMCAMNFTDDAHYRNLIFPLEQNTFSKTRTGQSTALGNYIKEMRSSMFLFK